MVLKTGADTIKLYNAFPYDTKPDTCFYSTGISDYDRLTMVDVTMRFEYRTADTARNIPAENRLLQELDSSNYRMRLEDPRAIDKIVNTRLLDSTLRALAKLAGIDTGFTYGVRKKGTAAFDLIFGGNTKELVNASYKAELFTDRAFTKPYELVLFIRNKDSIIFGTLLWTLASSSIIILLLIAAFIYFFKTVLAQKKLSEMKNDFINNMTHEFMTPVTNIALAIETLEKNKEQERPADNDRLVEVIASENAHLKENIDKVLQVAVLDRGRFVLNPTPVNIHAVLSRVARNFEIPVQHKKGQFIFELHAGEPVIVADETHIINLFYNIIDNAVKYSFDEGLQIIIRSGVANKKLWVSIEDNGKGMSSEVQKNIFDKFYRGSTGNVHDVKGFGLGLTYVKSIADAHNISIDVRSAEGKGTLFTLWFNQ
jgi:two-component system phosphate regulon sensor histidine kinase PhoR